MSRSRRLFRLGLRRADDPRDEMREELDFHVAARAAQLEARGMSPEAARAEAIRRLGSTLAEAADRLGRSAQRSERRLSVREWILSMAQDARFAFRGLVRRPGFTVVAVLTLAIGIGANTAIYSAVDALLLRSLPFRDPGRLMDIVQTSSRDGASAWSYPKYRFFAEAQKSFTSLAVHGSSATTITGAEPERVTIEEVSSQYLNTLGVQVVMGADMPADVDAAPGSRRVALISDALWQRRFSADAGAIGKVLTLNNEPWEIVGVLPPGFRGLSGRADAIVNLSARGADELNQPWSLEHSMIGRLKDGVTPEAAQAEARLLGPRIYQAFPMQAGQLTTSTAPEKWTADARPLNTIRVASGMRRSLLVLFGAVAMVLLIACVNLANLLAARAMTHTQEISLRLALGARRRRLVRLLVTESLVLAALATPASLAVALAGTRLLRAVNPQETLRVQGLEGGVGAVGFDGIHLDLSALAFTFLVTLVIGVLFGLAPALGASRADPVRHLRDGGSATGGNRWMVASRRALVIAEVALSLVLLVSSGLMIRSLGNLLNVNPGFDGHDVLTLRLSVPGGTVSPDSMPGFYEQLQASIRAVPGVQQVGLADCPPLNNGCNGTIMTFADRPRSATGNAMVGVHWVSPNWFSTMRVPLVRGRAFTDADRLGAPKVVMINEAAARKYFPGEDPIGKRVAVYQGGFHDGAEVIGIVGDVRFGTIDSTAVPDAFISYGQARIPRMMVFARVSGDPAALIASVRAAVRQAAPSSPVYDIRPMSARVATASAQARYSAVLLGFFAAVALGLAVMGIYGVMSYTVMQRSREIGIRVALGANRGSVLGLVVREGAMLAVAGVVIGVTIALAVTRVLRSMLFEVSTWDPSTYAAIVVVLLASVLAASVIPAKRATDVDPASALRKG